MAEPELTREAREAIRAYMLKLVALPGIGSVVIAFLIGFFIRDVAMRQAQYEAYNHVSKDVIQLAKGSETFKRVLDGVSADLDTLKEEFARLSAAASTLDSETSAFNERLTLAMRLFDGILKDKDKDTMIGALAALEAHPDAAQILARLHRIDQKLGAFEVRGGDITFTNGITVPRLSIQAESPVEPLHHPKIVMNAHPRYGPSFHMSYGAASISMDIASNGNIRIREEGNLHMSDRLRRTLQVRE